MLPKPGPVALRAVVDAFANLNVSEAGPPYLNGGPAVETYLRAVGLGPGYPWCAAFVEYRELTAAHALGVALPTDFPRSGYAASAANWATWAKDHGVWFTHDQAKPLRGDLVCFDIPSENGIHHIGFVAHDGDATGFGSVEGNTHPQGVVTRDGYCVAARQRSYAEIGPGGGFIRLRY